MLGRLIWFVVGCAFAAAAMVGWLGKDRVQQTVSGHNEIVFPRNPDVLRAGAITNRYPLIFERIPAGERVVSPGAIASAGDVTLILNSAGEMLKMDGERFVAVAFPPFQPPPLTDAGGALTLRSVYDLVLREGPDEGPGGIEAFVSFAYDGPVPACTTLGVARTVLTPAMLEQGGTPEWTWVFRSTPCIDGAGNQISLLGGGTMLLEGDSLTLAVGTFSLSLPKFEDTVAFLHSDDTSYGKVIQINLATGVPRHVARGLRDPTGLVRTANGTLWSLEHGPRGGDELNVIRDGANYGWPILTYGSAYGRFGWSGDPEPDRVAQLEPPRHAWVPSIAPSSMLLADSPVFPDWQGDLLVSALKGGQINRIRVKDGRVIFAEPILVGGRIRDMTQTDAGDLLVLMDRQPLVLRVVNAIERVKAAAPQAIFCVACHQLAPNTPDPGVGPTLVGIEGRAVAAVPGYAYSKTLQAMDGVWTTDRIIAFVKAPQTLALETPHPAIDMSNFRIEEFLLWLRAQQR